MIPRRTAVDRLYDRTVAFVTDYLAHIIPKSRRSCRYLDKSGMG